VAEGAGRAGGAGVAGEAGGAGEFAFHIKYLQLNFESLLRPNQAIICIILK